jgi:exopolysaccharide biosynthesis polyprenyl glycosylphosphotransferase
LLASHRPSDVGRDGIAGVSAPGDAMGRRLLDGRAGRQVIATTGQAVLVWLALAVIAASQHHLGTGGLLAITLAAGIWLVNLHVATGNAPYALGPWVPATMGATSGLVCVAALNPHLADMQFSLGALFAMFAGVLLSSGTWGWVLERTTKRRVLVVGTTAMDQVMTAVRRERVAPFEILGAPIEDPSGPDTRALSLSDAEDLAVVVEMQRPDVIVLTDDQSCSLALERLLDMTDRRFRVAGLTSFYEHAFGCVPLEQITSMWFLGLLHLRQRPGRRPAKRLFDVVVAAIGLLVMLPLIPVIVLLVKRTRGPLIYRQTRVSEGGRHFTMYKFRTMPVTAERPGEPVFAQASDPRASAAGRFLRRTHLDELPQLWNVLAGDMSIVGPRPERPEFVSMLEADVPFWSRRLLLKPGMTGWAQVRYGYATDCASSAEKLSYDFWYMRHGSLAVDIAVCFRTLAQELAILDPRPFLARRRSSADHGAGS